MNELRYLIMRIVRLALCLVCEAAGLAGVLFSVVWFVRMMFVLLTIGYPNMAHDMGIAAGLMTAWAVAAGVGWTLAFSIGIPYRFKWKMPGLEPRVCHRCKAIVADELECSACGAFRITRIGTMVVQVLNVLVTGLWILHDATIWGLALVLK